MKFNTEGYKYARWTLILIIIMFGFFAFVLIKDSFKTRADFEMISGKVTEEGFTKIKMVRGNNYSDAYYFGLSTHRQLFGIGTNENGISILYPSFEGVKVGDFIQVTFEGNWATDNEGINQMVYEIVRDGKILYDNMPNTYWNGRIKLGLICLIISLGVLTIFVILNRKYNRLTRKTN